MLGQHVDVAPSLRQGGEESYASHPLPTTDDLSVGGHDSEETSNVHE